MAQIGNPPSDDAFHLDDEYQDLHLDDEDQAALVADNLVLPKLAGGKRKVSGALLTPPTSGTSASSSPSASVSYRPRAGTSGTFDLPIHFHSVAAVEWCGFNPGTAESIIHHYHNRPSKDNNPDSLHDYMDARILSADSRKQLSTDAAFERMGLSQRIRDAIMDPRFEEVRRTETVTCWARDTVRVNYKTLERLMSNLKIAATRSRAMKQQKKHVGSVFPQPAAAGQSSAATAPSHSATIQSTLEGLSQERSLPSTHVATVASEPLALPDHYTLFKAKAAAEMNDFIDEDGNVVITRLLTYPGGDFNGVSLGCYWNLERATAQEYHHYARRRCPYSEIWIIRVQVQQSFIDGLTVKDMWYSQDWKEFVWYCRKQLQPPARYDDCLTADMIRGHVCKSGSNILTHVEKENIQEFINEGNVLVNPDGRKASQWCFIDQHGSVSRFGRELKGKIHIEITPPLSSEDPAKPAS